MIEIGGLDSLKHKIGLEIAVSDWLTVTQERVNAFAEATGDDQWIHMDRERAAASPLNGTIAHGFLTLSLVSTLLRQTITLPPLKMAINYGLNRVRFISPVPAGSRVRARIAVVSAETDRDAWQVMWGVTIERENAEKPAAVVEWIVRYHLAP
jgi:acyl dehydratase